MAPLIQDTDCLSLSSHDDDDVYWNRVKTVTAPLHIAAIPPRRCVSFGAFDYEYDVLSRHDYTNDELEASWFSTNDMRTMKQNARTDAKMLECGLLRDSSYSSPRGLEGRTTHGNERKYQSRMDAYAAVFSEIDFQNEVEYYDDELIADAYFIYSEQAAMLSQIIGKRDAIEAMDANDTTACRVPIVVDL